MDINVTCFPRTTSCHDTANAAWPIVLNLMSAGEHGGVTVFLDYTSALALASQLRIACGAEEPRTPQEVEG